MSCAPAPDTGPWRLVRAGLACACEAILPERCAACGIAAAFAEWEPAGAVKGGLRGFDRPHLCCRCRGTLFAAPICGEVQSRGSDAMLPVFAAAATSAPLVQVVGAWKYHGLRGLGWPLARALAAALPATGTPGSDAVLVPVPLYRSRRRQRGFNQAEMLAALAAESMDRTAAADVLVRTRATGQQARLAEVEERDANVAGAFRARPPAASAASRAFLVDDLVTAGSTVAAAAAALREAGWEVCGVLALGLAHRSG